MTLNTLFHRLTGLGLTLARDGHSVVVIGDSELDTELLDALREHKPTILPVLTTLEMPVDTQSDSPTIRHSTPIASETPASVGQDERVSDALVMSDAWQDMFGPWQDMFGERLAIMADCGGIAEDVARIRARDEVMAMMARPVVNCRCAECIDRSSP